LNALAAYPLNCDTKTSPLSDFSGASNNPIYIGSNGDLIVVPIYGNDYDENAHFTKTTGSIAGFGNVQFIAADNEDDVINAGAKTASGKTYYLQSIRHNLDAKHSLANKHPKLQRFS